jgi:capsular polysaccharide export protein
MGHSEIDRLIDRIRELRVGGTYWSAQPPLSQSPYLLVRSAKSLLRLRARVPANQPVLCWLADGEPRPSDKQHVHFVSGTCDPWHLLRGACSIIAESGDELCLLAASARLPVCSAEEYDAGGASASAALSLSALRQVFVERAIEGFAYSDPYTGEPMPIGEAVELCGFWRSLIDSNRDLKGVVGFAFWKRPTMAPLLWGGGGKVPFLSSAASIDADERVAVWKARTPARVLRELETCGAELMEVEDGFIRSAGLGAECVPPLSIVVDSIGAHFDAAHPSELEQMLQSGTFSSALLERARKLRQLIVESRVSKYSAGARALSSRRTDRRQILVPGQVEDDRAVISGGLGLTSNLELLRRVRAAEPDAYILYKPHPDVEAGHRRGAIADEQCLGVADEVLRDAPMPALLDIVDAVHVNTSLAGFEALLRGKPVTTHGLPFYAGWGLTTDLGAVPARRTAKRTLDELVAATLLLYPRYLDPVTGLPCPPEVLIHRLADAAAHRQDGWVVHLRRLQGRCRRKLAEIWAIVVG